MSVAICGIILGESDPDIALLIRATLAAALVSLQRATDLHF